MNTKMELLISKWEICDNNFFLYFLFKTDNNKHKYFLTENIKSFKMLIIFFGFSLIPSLFDWFTYFYQYLKFNSNWFF